MVICEATTARSAMPRAERGQRLTATFAVMWGPYMNNDAIRHLNCLPNLKSHQAMYDNRISGQHLYSTSSVSFDAEFQYNIDDHHLCGQI